MNHLSIVQRVSWSKQKSWVVLFITFVANFTTVPQQKELYFCLSVYYTLIGTKTFKIQMQMWRLFA